jgi:Fatty acid cis/trans isomerase (CTI)
MAEPNALMRRPTLLALIAGAIVLAGAISWFVAINAGAFQHPPDHGALIVPEVSSSDFDTKTLLRTVEQRCVVCHGCYDAPCQFRMTSADGVSRGASKQSVYNSSRLEDAPLTRLGIDASSVDEWRNLGFFDVTTAPQDADLAQSILLRMLVLGKKHTLPENAPLPKSVDLDILRELSCPAPDEFGRYEAKNPFGGMPYAMAPMADEDWATLSSWAAAGAPALQQSALAVDELTVQIAEWESFLNGSAPKERLVARYLYEHLFLAHLYFSQSQANTYFKLVRSSTPPGEPIRIIATRRPYDDPGADEFYYRLSRVGETILHKTHITYEIGPARLARYRELFLEPDWQVTELPSYEPTVASNPFAAFAAIPASARYQFLLDDVEYIIRTFIRGPVCRGQVAVNVIEDRFWVMFLTPDADLSVNDPEYLATATPFLGLPAEHAEGPLLDRLVPAYLDHHRQYAELREKRYNAADPQKAGPSLDAIWLGDENAGASLLTVFRHFDNATVVSGFVGDVPETAWVIDFPTLERIYYNLVAGFDVFGSVEHQIATRVYMDLLRIESEDLFLSFLPAERRRDIHDDWYRGGKVKIRTLLHQKPIDIDHATQIKFTTDAPKAELLVKALKRNQSGLAQRDPINRAGDRRLGHSPELAAISSITSTQGPWVRYLPDLSLVRIKNPNGKDRVYSLIHDKAHTNIAFLFAENLRREPEKDTVTVIEGQIGSYPNFFFVVEHGELNNFVHSLSSVSTQQDWRSFIDAFGIRRSSPQFWETADFFQEVAHNQHPRKGGLLDLNRYDDP